MITQVGFDGVSGDQIDGFGARGTAEPPAPVVPPAILDQCGLRLDGDAKEFVLHPPARSRDGELSGASGTAIVTATNDPDLFQFLLVRTDDGLRAVLPTSRSSLADQVEYQFAVSPGPGTDRGVFSSAAKWVLQKVVFPVTDAIIGDVSRFVVGEWEERARPHRMRWYAPDGYTLPGKPIEPTALRGGPLLLLIHGTNSLSHSTSGIAGLPRTTVEQLWSAYGRNVVAFDHPTLSVKPDVNARWLAEWLSRLPEPVEVDVLAHSRGGLVARLLAERGETLGHDLSSVRFRTLNLVATPNRGTPLADEKQLGRFGDRLLSLASKLPDNPVTTTVEGALTFVKQLAAGVFHGLDGVLCMAPPSSGPGTWLEETFGSGPPDGSNTVYRAVSADFEPRPGSGLWAAIKDGGVDLVFGGLPNDVVVPSLSALSLGDQAGTGMKEMVFFDEFDDLQHSTILRHDLAQPVFTSWLRPDPVVPLTGPITAKVLTESGVASLAQLGPEFGLRKLLDLTCLAPKASQETLQKVVTAAGGIVWNYVTGRGDEAPPPLVVLVPGVMGSELKVRDDVLWVSPWRIAQGMFKSLRDPHAGDEVQASDLLCLGYRATLDQLSKSYEVVGYPYDWRKDLTGEPATGLITLLEAVLAASGDRAVHIVAHSMGTLVTRQALVDKPSLAAALEAKGRIVFAGPPSRGAVAAPLAMLGQHPVLSGLSKLDIRSSLADWLDVAWTFPGLLQLLPAPDRLMGPDGSPDPFLYEATHWKGRNVDAAMIERTQAVLELARSFHEGLPTEAGANNVHLVLGDGVDTPVTIAARGAEDFVVGFSRRGDGTVGHEWSTLDGATIHYARGVGHGDLVKDQQTLLGIKQILADAPTAPHLHDTPTPTDSRGGETADLVSEWLDPDQARVRLEQQSAVSRGATSRGAAGSSDASADVVWTRRDALDDTMDALSTILGTSATTRRPFVIELLHGDLADARYPVLLGHGSGTPIGGAEARADQLLGGRLRTLQSLGLYPDSPKERRYIPKTVDQHRLPGCIVIGLDSGEPPSEAVLADQVTQAALDYAERWTAEVAPKLADPQEAVAPLGLASVAVATGPIFGLSAERSARAVVTGVLRANDVLASLNRTQFEHLQFIELYASKLELVARELGRFKEQRVIGRNAQPVEVRDPTEGEDARPGSPPPEYSGGRWERLSIEVVENEGDDARLDLKYRFARDKAAVSETPRRIDLASVRQSLDVAIRLPGRSLEQGRTLYDDLLPVELKSQLVNADNLVLQVDERTADIPWELLVDRASRGEALAVRTGLLRQFRELGLRDRPGVGLPSTALVFGDPPIGPPPGTEPAADRTVTGLPRLPGAAEEAKEVAGLLRQAGVDVDLLDFGHDTDAGSTSVGQIRQHFWDRDNEIIHIAAHGLYETRGPAGQVTGGIAIGPDSFLIADDFRNLRVPPRLVFLNCCHLGRIEQHAPRFFSSDGQQRVAASIARELMRIGVRALIVAGWQVDDGEAKAFATEFYRCMTAGELFGDAVKQARLRCFDDRGLSNTWGAYQCYGDPSFRLRQSADGGGLPATLNLRSVIERSLHVLLSRASQANDPRPLVADADAMHRRVLEMRPQDGALLALCGQLWSYVGRFDKAIEAYASAVAAPDSGASLHDLEQLANLRSRWASQLYRANGGWGEGMDKQLVGAMALDEIIAKLNESTERSLINGGLYKRLAVLTTISGTRPRRLAKLLETDPLVKAVESYLTASEESGSAGDGFLTAIQLVGLTPPLLAMLEPRLTSEWMKRWAENVGQALGKGGFWARACRPDSRLAAILVPPGPMRERIEELLVQAEVDDTTRATFVEWLNADLGDKRAELAKEYQSVAFGGRPEHQWLSIVDHIWDLSQLAPARSATQRALAALYADLTALGPDAAPSS